jgi:hypothetical protein
MESLPSKRKILKKGARIEKKQTRGNLNGKAPCFEKRKEREDEIYKLLGDTLDSIKRKKGRRSQFPIVKNLMCGLIHTHTSFAFALPSIP